MAEGAADRVPAGHGAPARTLLAKDVMTMRAMVNCMMDDGRWPDRRMKFWIEVSVREC